MKKIVLACSMLLFVSLTFAQTEKKNGTIYINHPFIDVVNKATKAYIANDLKTWKSLFEDSAKFSISGMDKSLNLKDNLDALTLDHKFFDNITVKTIGYPDYLHYDKDDSKVVQSWWKWSGKSKKTGKVLSLYFVQFDDFNNAGKIIKESILGDFSKQFAEEGVQ
jgi:hypothetical protein